ncbi:hypothetical protein CPB84DRAFT_817629 [Gymnopilus junonius]|uniref:F-box domain-containing protein n=1 Tax=Gymnopilus junonius TaxID=109634 RepID=A0A9P5NT57_GYMJU|nr:hypothetical protein CPB84DRAFT_817629 [Gymnopilus junonius]
MDGPESWLHDEVRRLERENKALRKENEDLAEEILDSQEEMQEKINAYDEILHKISYLRKPFSQPPPEILHMIFERTIPPYFIIDSSASLCLNPIWVQVQQQKKSIVEVCRAWHDVALPFLWEDVVILRVYELSNLLSVLKDDSLKLRRLIRRVEIHCFIPLWYEEHFARQLQLLFATCPRISSCSFLSQCPPPPKLLPTALGNASNITSLVLSHDNPIDIIGPLLILLSPYLVSLSFHISASVIPSISDLPRCHLLHLRDLTIWVSHASAGNLSSLAVGRWLEIPSIIQLTFGLRSESWSDDVSTGCLSLFCKEYGSAVRFLQIQTRMLKGNYIGAQSLLDLCPAIEHFVVHPNIIGDFSSLTHKKIKWIDIWFNDEPLTASKRDLGHKLPRANFPALQAVRFLQHTDALPYNLPLLIPPGLVRTAEDTFSFQFLDFEMRHDYEQVHFVQPDWVAAVGSKPYEGGIYSDEDDMQEDEHSTEGESSFESSEDESENGAGDERNDSDTDSSSADSESGSDLINSITDFEPEMDALETDTSLFDEY